ncbi:hypothetical protein [Mucilaginibacter lappiensis]|uniref:hypothetical protein n=1 Tax=Mucilaginibacter lappiensis TaxID=354630 RepID=UPI003D1E001A
MERGIEAGYFRPEINIKIMARMRVDQIEAGFDPHLFPAAVFNLWEVQSQLLTHFNQGICTMKGIGELNRTKT